jgi:hypothetical protein
MKIKLLYIFALLLMGASAKAEVVFVPEAHRALIFYRMPSGAVNLDLCEDIVNAKNLQTQTSRFRSAHCVTISENGIASIDEAAKKNYDARVDGSSEIKPEDKEKAKAATSAELYNTLTAHADLKSPQPTLISASELDLLISKFNWLLPL